jgi:dTDP-4-amino-4,6-dideoxygalactose transaminase
MTMMSAAMRSDTVEELLRKATGRNHCFLVGRGTTAIYLALKAIEERSGLGDIILPTMACASLAQMVLYAGFRPVFADIDSADFTLDQDSLQSKLTKYTKGIMPVHIFGHAARMDEICRFATDSDLFVIEDAAQAVGGRCAGKPMGGHGDFSIFSFGGEKIINAGAGGAILTDDNELAAIIRAHITTLPTFSRTPSYALKSLSHRNLYHALIDLLRVDRSLRVDSIFLQAIRFYEDLYLQSFPSGSAVLENIARGIETIDEDNRLRIARACQYRKSLSQGDLSLSSNWLDSAALWRFSFLVNNENKTGLVTSALRKARIHASNHYWSLADLFYGDKSLPNTNYVCPRIVNLWVDGTATPEYIAKSCDIILGCLQ